MRDIHLKTSVMYRRAAQCKDGGSGLDQLGPGCFEGNISASPPDLQRLMRRITRCVIFFLVIPSIAGLLSIAFRSLVEIYST